MNKCISNRVQSAFNAIYNDSQKSPIHSVGGQRNSNVAGTETLSAHVFGLAIDINAQESCHSKAGACYPKGTYYNPCPASACSPYSITAGSSIVRSFKAQGFGWGGDWNTSKDYMHVSCTQNEHANCN